VTSTGDATQHVTSAPARAEPGSDAMYRAIVETAVNPYVVLDTAGHVRWCSDRVETLIGRSAASVIGLHFLDLIHPSSHEAVMAEYAEFVDEEHVRRAWIGPPMLLEMVHADGSRVTCEVSAATASGHGIDGIVVQVRRWRGTVLLYAAVDALAAGDPLDTVLAGLAAIVEHDMPGSVVFVAAGWDGAHFDLVAPAPGTPPEQRGLAARIAELSADEWRRDDGAAAGMPDLAVESGLASCWAIPITVRGDHRPSAAIVILRPIDMPPQPHNTTVQRVATLVALAIESDRNRRAWRRSAVTDQLTELPNRSGLDEWLRARAADRPDDVVALLFCDVDEFKAVNDQLGHAMGDRTLQVVAERLRRSVRDGDLVCRWGGDEFVVACTDVAAAEGLARRLIEHVQDPIGLDQHTARVGLSVGVSFGTFATPLDDLLRESDRALLEAKSRGRNRYVMRG
jgi:diguanylate cyclase (GGDEF)-like protein/PAS domain S-box-containing protein